MKPQHAPISPRRHRQQGGIAIIVALVLISVMGAAAFGLARNSIRELGITGTVVQGTKADKAADAGLDWYITWCHPDNVLANETATTTAPGILADTIVGLKRPNWSTYTFAGATHSPYAWDRAATITSDVTASSTNDMVFDTTGTNVKQSTAAGNSIVQKFDLTLRFLGSTGGTGAGNPSGGTDTKGAGTQDLLWQVTSRGSASIPSAGIAFTQTREIIGIQSRSQD